VHWIWPTLGLRFSRSGWPPHPPVGDGRVTYHDHTPEANFAIYGRLKFNGKIMLSRRTRCDKVAVEKALNTTALSN
jgi:hypothetical protein